MAFPSSSRMIMTMPACRLGEIKAVMGANLAYRPQDAVLDGAVSHGVSVPACRLDEIKAVLGARLAYGPQDATLDSAVSEVVVATGSVNELLGQVAACRSPCLVVTSQDRTDVLLALAAMRLIGSSLPISGMLLTSAGSARS